MICGNATDDEATIPSLGYLFHHGVAVLGSDPYRYHEFAEAWSTYLSVRPAPEVDVEPPSPTRPRPIGGSRPARRFGRIVLRP